MKSRSVLSPEKMQVVVLMGGLGTRLGGVLGDLPKAMAPLAGKPFFRHQLELLKLHGFRTFLFLVGAGADAVRRYFGDGRRFGVRISYADDGARLLGTGGALRSALPFLAKEFMLIYGDSYMDVDYGELIYAYRAARADGRQMLMTVLHNRGRFDRSNVVYRQGAVLIYDKTRRRSGMDAIDYGISILSRDLVRRIRARVPSDLGALYARLAGRGLIGAHLVGNRFYEIGTSRALAACRTYLAKRASARQPAVILDRDGVLNELVVHDATGLVDSPLAAHELKLLPRVAAALRILKRKGYLLIVITNQPAVAKGKMTMAAMAEINSLLRDKLAAAGVTIDDLLVCPHHPAGTGATKHRFLVGPCACRKPANALYRFAIRKWHIDTARSWAIGDSHTDVLAARRSGLKCAFVGTYRCDICRLLERAKPAMMVDDLYTFAKKVRCYEEAR